MDGFLMQGYVTNYQCGIPAKWVLLIISGSFHYHYQAGGMNIMVS